MSRLTHLDQERAIASIQEGMRARAASRKLGCHHGIILRLDDCFQETQSTRDPKGIDGNVWQRMDKTDNVCSITDASTLFLLLWVADYALLNCHTDLRWTNFDSKPPRLPAGLHRQVRSHQWHGVLFSEESRFHMTRGCQCGVAMTATLTALCKRRVGGEGM